MCATCCGDPAARRRSRLDDRFSALLGAALLLLAASALASTKQTTLTLDCRDPATVSETLIAFDAQHHSASISLSEASGALIEIEERDLEIALTVNGTAQALDSEAPPRFGRGFLAADEQTMSLQLERVVASHARGIIALRLYCAPAQSTRAMAHWLRDLRSATEDSTIVPLPVARANSMHASLITLGERAPDTWTQALATHWQAQVLLLSGQTERAASGFMKASAQWQSVGDLDRAAAADVAYVEDLQRLGRSQEVLEYNARQVHADLHSYYPARRQHASCVAYRYLAQYDLAQACFQRCTQAFAEMGDYAEMVSVMQNHAQLEHLRGHDAEADSLLKAAFEAISGPDANMLRGRVLSLRADLAQSRADIPEALVLLDASLQEFSRSGIPRWEGNVLLKVAALHRELMSFPDAYAAVTEAFARFPPKDAPSRVAAALLTLARIDEANARPQMARRWLTKAERIYAEQQLPLERNGAQGALAVLALAEGDVASAQRLIEAADPAITYYHERWALVRAGAALQSGLPEAALTILATTKDMPLTLPERIQTGVMRAHALLRLGDRGAAVASITELRALIEQIAGSARSPLLRYLVARRLESVEREALALQLNLEDASNGLLRTDDGEQIWPTVQRRAALMDLAPRAAIDIRPADRNLDRAITAELLGQALPSTPATSDLLQLLAQGRRENAPSKPRSIGLSEYLAGLPDDTMVLTHTEVADRGAVLVLGRNFEHVAMTGPHRAVLASSARLRAALANPASAVDEIERRADELSALLFGTAPATAAPSRLHIDRDSLLAGIPWPVMCWPGTDRMLVDTTVVSIAPLLAPPRSAQRRANTIDVIVAGEPSRLARTQLQALPNASAEADAIRALALARGIAVNALPSARRADVLASLENPQHVLHIAAHGLADNTRIGHSGIWLSASDADGSQGEFVGWSEPIMRGVHTELVVLNACSLASRQDAADASMSFATALSRAGAQDVVAALWSTSDASSAMWVPMFYTELWREDGNDPARALSVAVDTLRRSRMFRHPFYWASLVHVGGGG